MNCYSIIKNGLPDKELQVRYYCGYDKNPDFHLYSTPIDEEGLIKELTIQDKTGEILRSPVKLECIKESYPRYIIDFTYEFSKIAERVASLHLGKKVTINSCEDAEKIRKLIDVSV